MNAVPHTSFFIIIVSLFAMIAIAFLYIWKLVKDIELVNRRIDSIRLIKKLDETINLYRKYEHAEGEDTNDSE